MPEKQPEFVVTDRRKFRADGEPTPEAAKEERAEEKAREETKPAEVHPKEVAPAAEAKPDGPGTDEQQEYRAPTEEETRVSNQAYQQTTDRIDDLIRASNPGAQREGPMNFERLVQSLYVTAIVQMGGATPQGQQVRVDLMGARQTIDMLGVIAEKTTGNLTAEEEKQLQAILFEVRISFLDVTQALAQSAANRPAGAGAPGAPMQPGMGNKPPGR